MQALSQSAATAEAVRAWFARASVQQLAEAEFVEDPSVAQVVLAAHRDGTLELTIVRKDGSMEGGTL